MTASYYGLAEAQPPLGQTLGVLLGEVRLPTTRGPGGPPKLDNLTSPGAASEMCVGGTACENSMGWGSGSVQGAAAAVVRFGPDRLPRSARARKLCRNRNILNHNTATDAMIISTGLGPFLWAYGLAIRSFGAIRFAVALAPRPTSQTCQMRKGRVLGQLARSVGPAARGALQRRAGRRTAN